MQATIAVIKALPPFTTKEYSTAGKFLGAYCPQKTNPAMKCQKKRANVPTVADKIITRTG